MNDQAESGPSQAPRRNFLLEFWSVAIGGIIGLVPTVAGIVAILDPLRRSDSDQGKKVIRVASLDAVPADGIPRRFPVVADKKDAWTYSPDESIGAVFLRRLPGTDEVKAFNVVCPHAGCSVGYHRGADVFQCPCHTSAFTLDGEIIDPSPSPRGLDELDTEITSDGGIEVAFVNYYPGKHEQIPKQ